MSWPLARFQFTVLIAAAVCLAACRDQQAPRPHDEGAAADPGAESTIDPPQASPAKAELVDGVQIVEIEVTAVGYLPSSIQVEPGIPASLVFIRTSPDACEGPIELPAYDVETPLLPLNQRVALDIEPRTAGVFQFICADVLRGRLVISS